MAMLLGPRTHTGADVRCGVVTAIGRRQRRTHRNYTASALCNASNNGASRAQLEDSRSLADEPKGD